MPANLSPRHGDVDVKTPVIDEQPTTHYENLLKEPEHKLKPRFTLYTSIIVAMVVGVQYGWSISQLNLSTFHESDDCNARPVPEGRCLMFPGHSDLEWVFAVNAWIFGGMIGSLGTGHFAKRYGPRNTLRGACGIIIVSVAIQASSYNVWQFVVGRLVAGLASGASSSIISAYISEVCPPHLRSAFGVGFPLVLSISILLVAIAFFFADTSSGWRYIAGFPLIPTAIYLVGSFTVMVESPPWLLVQGRREEAKQELARLYGEEGVAIALAWIEPNGDESRISQSYSDLGDDIVHPLHDGKTPTLFSREMILQLLVALGVIGSRQLSGINTVFYYSADLFVDAGIEDDRIGTVIINGVNCIPPFIAGVLATKLGNKKTLISTSLSGILSLIGLTTALITHVPALSIVFTATFVISINGGLGALAWVVAADVFPDEVRPSGFALCVASQWLANLIVGVGYPYLASAIGTLRYVPFIGILVISVLFMVMELPETSGKTNKEIQQYFQKRQNK